MEQTEAAGGDQQRRITVTRGMGAAIRSRAGLEATIDRCGLPRFQPSLSTARAMHFVAVRSRTDCGDTVAAVHGAVMRMCVQSQERFPRSRALRSRPRMATGTQLRCEWTVWLPMWRQWHAWLCSCGVRSPSEQVRPQFPHESGPRSTQNEPSSLKQRNSGATSHEVSCAAKSSVVSKTRCMRSPAKRLFLFGLYRWVENVSIWMSRVT
jgi:hypothetical protein